MTLAVQVPDRPASKFSHANPVGVPRDSHNFADRKIEAHSRGVGSVPWSAGEVHDERDQVALALSCWQPLGPTLPTCCPGDDPVDESVHGMFQSYKSQRTKSQIESKLQFIFTHMSILIVSG